MPEKQAVVLENYRVINSSDYPQDWFEKYPGRKPLNVPTTATDLEQLVKYMMKLDLSSFTTNVATQTISETAVSDWRSMNIWNM